LKFNALVPRLYKVTVWELGETPPAVAVNRSPAGCATGLGLSSGGSTFSTVEIIWGALLACGAETVTLS
jgi:hypothetical protein